MSDHSRFPLLAFVVALLGAAVYILITAGQLPPRVASHFGGDGLANGYMSRDGYRLFMLLFTVGLPLLMVAVVGGLPARFPKWSNLPHKDHWFAPERRDDSLAFLRRHAYWFGTLLVFFMTAIHTLIIQANAQTPPRLAEGPFLGMMAVFLGGLAVWIVALLWRFRKPPA